MDGSYVRSRVVYWTRGVLSVYLDVRTAMVGKQLVGWCPVMLATVLLGIFFFSSRRRHTRLQGDWSSDVCSSDLGDTARSPRVVSDTGGFSLTLTRVGSTGVYAGVATLSHGTAFTWHYEAGDRRLDRKSVV